MASRLVLNMINLGSVSGIAHAVKLFSSWIRFQFRLSYTYSRLNLQFAGRHAQSWIGYDHFTENLMTRPLDLCS